VACKTQPQVPERLQRLVFGEDAELYDETRPTYPGALVDDLVAWAGSERRALEVGAGTGKATRLLAARGVSILAIEPSADMAAVARRAITGPGEVEIVVSDFERADLGGRRFPLVYAGQAWHWVDPETGFPRARAALHDGGHLVVFWNRPVWDDSPVTEALLAAYERALPQRPSIGAMHPTSRTASEDRAYWPRAIAEAEGFGDPETREYAWRDTYTAERYATLLSTLSDVRLLAGEDQARLVAETRAAVQDVGGSFELAMVTLTAIAQAM
jgi:SAM-dependent methyltransferase